MVLHLGEPVFGVLRAQIERFPEHARGVRLVQRERGAGAQVAAAALSSSGTMSLSLALAGIPGAIVYRANPLTWFVGRRLVKGIEYLGIANILLKRPAWPEYLQGEANPVALAARLEACLEDLSVAYVAQEDAATLHTMLGGGEQGWPNPAEWLLEWLPETDA